MKKILKNILLIIFIPITLFYIIPKFVFNDKVFEEVNKPLKILLSVIGCLFFPISLLAISAIMCLRNVSSKNTIMTILWGMGILMSCSIIFDVYINSSTETVSEQQQLSPEEQQKVDEENAAKLAQEEADRLASESKAAEKAKLEADRVAKEEADRVAKEEYYAQFDYYDDQFGFKVDNTKVDALGTVWIDGRVIPFKKDYNYLQIEFDLLTESGGKLGSALANVNGVDKGQTWHFSAMGITNGKGGKYKFNEITGW